MKPETVIGLEIHARLRTRTKMFCACPNAAGGEPNSRICPVCLGLPGSLPTVNRRAVELGARIALALGARVAPESRFDRKSYFYPDLPRNYQITQFAEPLAVGGGLDVPGAGSARLIRIHLEEDAGRLVHRPGETLVDLNRAGAPLAEIVTRPDLRTGDEAARWLAELRLLLIHLDACDGEMAAGSLRCDANISVRPRGSDELGAAVELKNLNSISGLRRALEFEAARQAEILRSGGAVERETRGWDPDRGRTYPMRGKETAPDYRYFPEPDLPPLAVDPADLDAWRAGLPEPPAARRGRYVSEMGIAAEQAAVLVETPAEAEYFERTAAAFGDPREAARWICGELRRIRRAAGAAAEDPPVAPERLAALLAMLRDRRISSAAAKIVLERMADTGEDPGAIVRREGLSLSADPRSVEAAAAAIAAENPDQAEAWAAGKTGLLEWFVGRLMARTGGRADPVAAREVMLRELKSRK